MDDPVQIPNPMPMLVREERIGDLQAREALFLTYSIDLAFFESRVLGTCLSAGARVAVIADSDVWDPDARAVRAAGRSYHVGLVTSRAAFHPKLVMLVGTERAQVAIGSGNLNMGGWQYNSEIWIQFSADKDSHPVIFRDMVAWLEDLASSKWLDAHSRESVKRNSDYLRDLLEHGSPVDTGHSFVCSAKRPILESLPNGPVSDLRLHAPFLDPEAVALKELHERLLPAESSLLVQRERTVLRPASIATRVKQFGINLLEDPAEKDGYRHGKLVWWDSGGGTEALIGSPNLSRAALLKSWETGGNYEICVVGPAPSIQWPSGKPINVGDLVPAPETLMDSQSTNGGLSITAAQVDGDELLVTLSAPAPAGLHLEGSDFRLPPEEWHLVAVLPEGRTEARVASSLPAVSRVCLAAGQESEKARWSIVFLTDPVQVANAPRSKVAQKPYTSPPPEQIWEDENRALDYLSHDFELLRTASLPSHRVQAATPTEASASNNQSSAHELNSPWLWDAGEAAQIHGASMVSFVLGLPATRNTPVPATDPVWADQLVDDNEAALDDEADDSVQDVLNTDDLDEESPPNHRRSKEGDRRKRRKRSEEWVKTLDDQPPFIRLAVLRIVTSFYSAGNWEQESTQPLTLIADAVESLTLKDTPEDLQPAVASMVLVSCAVLRGSADFGLTTQASLIYKRAIGHAEQFVDAFDEERLDEYCKRLVGRDEHTLRRDHVIDMIENDMAQDPLAEARAAAGRKGWAVTVPKNDRIFVSGTFSNPELVAIQVTGWLRDDDSPPVWAVMSNGKWCLCMWQRPHLMVADGRGARIIWKHFILNSHVSPAVFAEQRRTDPSYSVGRQRLFSPNEPFADAALVMDRWNMAGPAPLITASDLYASS